MILVQKQGTRDVGRAPHDNRKTGKQEMEQATITSVVRGPCRRCVEDFGFGLQSHDRGNHAAQECAQEENMKALNMTVDPGNHIRWKPNWKRGEGARAGRT